MLFVTDMLEGKVNWTSGVYSREPVGTGRVFGGTHSGILIVSRLASVFLVAPVKATTAVIVLEGEYRRTKYCIHFVFDFLSCRSSRARNGKKHFSLRAARPRVLPLLMRKSSRFGPCKWSSSWSAYCNSSLARSLGKPEG